MRAAPRRIAAHVAIFAVSPAAFVRVVYASPCSELLSIAMRSVERDAERVGRPPPTVSESGEWRRVSIDAAVADRITDAV